MISRIRLAFARAMLKAAGLSFAPQWMRAAWSDLGFRSLVVNGYKGSAAMWACVRVWATTFPEPEMHVRLRTETGREWVRDHPARALIARPNPFMGEDQFWSTVITWLAIGGNCYIWKERSRARAPIALWPFHDGQMEPVPDPDGWLSHYLYDPGNGQKVLIPREDVIHLMWAPDPLQPIRGLAPAVAAARAIDMGNEAARAVYAMLKNDAVPRTLVNLKEPVGERLEQMKTKWIELYGGDNRGLPGFIEGSEATVTRIGSNLQELALEALWNMPEAWITAAFEVPAIKVGLNIGLMRGTYANADALNTDFTVSRLMPRWRNVGAQFTTGLLPDFSLDEALSLEFDTSTVTALREDENELRSSLNASVTAGWMRVDESRARAGLEVTDADRVYLRGPMVMEIPALPPPPEPVEGEPPPEADESAAAGGIASLNFTGIQISSALDIISRVALGTLTLQQADTALQAFLGIPADVAAKLLEDAGAGLPGDLSAKAEPSAGDLRRQFAEWKKQQDALAKATAPKIEAELTLIRSAAAARAAAKTFDPAAAKPRSVVDDILRGDDFDDLRKVVHGQWQAGIADSFSIAGRQIGTPVKVNQKSPTVRKLLDQAGERIKGIEDVTRTRVQGYVERAIDEGLSPEGLRDLIMEDASGAFSKARAMTISRTEAATVYSLGSIGGYRDSGRVEKVIVFDGDGCGWTGHDDDDVADGSIRTLDEAEEYPLGHPNCVRAFAPYVESAQSGDADEE